MVVRLQVMDHKEGEQGLAVTEHYVMERKILVDYHTGALICVWSCSGMISGNE